MCAYPGDKYFGCNSTASQGLRNTVKADNVDLIF